MTRVRCNFVVMGGTILGFIAESSDHKPKSVGRRQRGVLGGVFFTTSSIASAYQSCLVSDLTSRRIKLQGFRREACWSGGLKGGREFVSGKSLGQVTLTKGSRRRAGHGNLAGPVPLSWSSFCTLPIYRFKCNLRVEDIRFKIVHIYSEICEAYI